MSTPQPTYTISNLAHTTQYYVWIQAEDGIGNVSAPYQLPPSTTVTADGTPPQFSGSNVGLAGVGSDSIKVSWDAGFTDGTGVQSGLVYYSTADPGSNLAAWKASASNSSVAASNLGAAGEKTVGSLAAGTYYAYLSVADAAGNTLDVRPSPASVALAAPVTNPPATSADEYYGDYTSSTVATGSNLTTPLAGVPLSFTFAKDDEDLYLSTGKSTYAQGSGPAALLKYDHATRTFENLGSASKTTANVSLNYRGHGVALVNGVPYVAERYKDATTQGHVVHRYVAGSGFQQVGETFGSDGYGNATAPGHVLIKYDLKSDRLYVGYIASGSPTIKYIDSPASKTATTGWNDLTLSGAATQVIDFYFAFAPSGLMWLLMLNGTQFAAYTVSVAGSAGNATVRRPMGTLTGATNTVYQNAAFITAFDDKNVAMHVGITKNSFVLVVNDAFKYPALPDNEQEHNAADAVGFDAFGRVFAFSATLGKVYRYVPSGQTWSVVVSSVSNCNRGVLAVSNKNGDIVVAGFDATFAYRVIRPTATFPAPISTEGAIFTASSEYTEVGYGTFPARLAFNRFTGSTGAGDFNSWLSDSATTQWLQAQFPSATTVAKYRIYPRYESGGAFQPPTNYKLQGSNDGVTFTDLDVRAGMPTLTNVPTAASVHVSEVASTAYVENVVQTPGSYRYYRLYMTRETGGMIFYVGDLLFFRMVPNYIVDHDLTGKFQMNISSVLIGSVATNTLYDGLFAPVEISYSNILEVTIETMSFGNASGARIWFYDNVTKPTTVKIVGGNGGVIDTSPIYPSSYRRSGTFVQGAELVSVGMRFPTALERGRETRFRFSNAGNTINLAEFQIFE